MFCKDLQKILKSIYELTRKTMPFYWAEVHQKAFEQIKELLTKPLSDTYLDQEVDSFYIVILPKLRLVALFCRYKMANPDF